ncbi:MAG: RHS repeat-associated core domain-containing protein [Gemmatimonadota bacterium]|nr:RHS repeat-associated core domain-containing protein [Gemmatimonadota bacterium]
MLWELRDQNLAGPANPPAGTQTGKIGYIHGIAIDAPLGMIRNGTGIVLHRNTRGQYLMGTPLNGTIDTDIIWPAASWTAPEELYLIPTPNPYRVRSWYGSLIFGQTDATGLQYKRNRYYSPNTGQFTQPDPIGIAGGMNVYGYANGDPVNFKDPFGLDKCKERPVEDCRTVITQDEVYFIGMAGGFVVGGGFVGSTGFYFGSGMAGIYHQGGGAVGVDVYGGVEAGRGSLSAFRGYSESVCGGLGAASVCRSDAGITTYGIGAGVARAGGHTEFGETQTYEVRSRFRNAFQHLDRSLRAGIISTGSWKW